MLKYLKSLLTQEVKMVIEHETLISFENVEGKILTIKRKGKLERCKGSASVILALLDCKKILNVQEVTTIYEEKNQDAEVNNTLYSGIRDRFGIEASRTPKHDTENESGIFGKLSTNGFDFKRFDFQ